MTEKINVLLDFVHSTIFIYILCGCWLLNVITLKNENKKLMQKLSDLQQENARFQKSFNGSASEYVKG